MSQKLAPAIKGIITAAIMIAATLLIDRYHTQVDERLQFLVYVVYLAGIIWTLTDIKNSSSFSGKFSELFSTGFRCFIVVTLVMVVFTFIFLKTHPGLAEQEAVNTRAYYQGKDKTPVQIEEIALKAKKQYPVVVISLSIFRYLILGALFTAGSGIIINRKP